LPSAAGRKGLTSSELNTDDEFDLDFDFDIDFDLDLDLLTSSSSSLPNISL
jgi:hypothetical protein